MPDLELSSEEVRELRQALEDHLHSLRVELAGADLREFKAELRHRIERLEAISARLKAH
jgi:hypothetical protein